MFSFAPMILGPLCLASLGMEGLDQARLHLTLSRHIIFGFAPRILGPLCLASLGLEGIGSSSFTFDSLAARKIWLTNFRYFICESSYYFIYSCIFLENEFEI